MIKDKDLVIREIKSSDIVELWRQAFRDNLEWMKWNGPYFEDPVYDEEQFIYEIAPKYYLNKENKYLIEIDSKIIGVLSYHFEDRELKKWLEFGVLIFDEPYWGQGIGQRTCRLWMNYIFEKYEDIQRIGFTTWSGNERMIKLGQKLGMIE